MHVESEEALKKLLAMKQSDDASLYSFLYKLNVGPDLTGKEVKTLVLMDATGSMSNLLEKCKNSVDTMFR